MEEEEEKYGVKFRCQNKSVAERLLGHAAELEAKKVELKRENIQIDKEQAATKKERVYAENEMILKLFETKELHLKIDRNGWKYIPWIEEGITKSVKSFLSYWWYFRAIEEKLEMPSTFLFLFLLSLPGRFI